jgi:hypothetical protein
MRPIMIVVIVVVFMVMWGGECSKGCEYVNVGDHYSWNSMFNESIFNSKPILRREITFD